MSEPGPSPDYIGPREGAQAFLQRETSYSPDLIRRWLSLSQQADQEWPYYQYDDGRDDPDLTIAWIILRGDARFEIRIERKRGRPSHAPPHG
jgi:hypothetical protein